MTGSFFSFESTTSQDDEVFLTNIISDFIKEPSSNSAAVSDGVSATLLVNCATELVPSIWILFILCLDSGVIDQSLPKSAIVHIFKSGDRTVPSNYHYISLTSVIIKVFERVVHTFLISKGHLNPTQHGFRGGHSCLSTLLSDFDDVMEFVG